jgi:SAM-dependent methyltransferase
MLDRAAQEGGDDVTLRVADMRELPDLGDFDLVLSLNDSVNYLLGDEDLVVALARMRANLADDGLLIFDVNSSSAFAGGYTGTHEVEHEGSRWRWTGRGEVAPSIFETEISGDRIEPIKQLERFRPEREVLDAMQAAGLRSLAAYGMSEVAGVVELSTPPDEDRDYKLVFIGSAETGRA